MPMIEMPVTPAAGAEVVIEWRVGEAGNRGLSPVVPIALSVVKVLAVKENIIEIDDIDAFADTPVLDLKP